MPISPRARGDRDDLILAGLMGASSRHAGWTDPTGDARAQALAELRDIATQDKQLRTDLLAQAAGICRGYELEGGASAEQDGIQAGLLIEAGADPGLLEEWTAVGRDRATRAAAAMRHGRP